MREGCGSTEPGVYSFVLGTYPQRGSGPPPPPVQVMSSMVELFSVSELMTTPKGEECEVGSDPDFC